MSGDYVARLDADGLVNIAGFAPSQVRPLYLLPEEEHLRPDVRAALDDGCSVAQVMARVGCTEDLVRSVKVERDHLAKPPEKPKGPQAPWLVGW